MNKPTFLIIGAQKAGTTTFYEWLKECEDVYMSPIKETHFFTNLGRNIENEKRNVKVITDEETYWSLFRNTDSKIIGEASPSYLYSRRAATNISKLIPDCKLIAILRNPVDRAYSNYLHNIRAGIESKSFNQVLIDEDITTFDGYGSRYDYIKKGLYHDQLSRYFNLFNEKNILVLIYEEVFTSENSILDAFNEILEFIGENKVSHIVKEK